MVTFPPGYISVNSSNPQVVQPNGSVLWPSYFNTFGSNWNAVKTQYKNDMVFLASLGVKFVRFWAGLSTFCVSGSSWTGSLNSNIANLDDFLATLSSVGMKALIVLMDTPEDPSEVTVNYISPSMINDSATQTAYLNSLTAFVSHYASNTTIWGYDLANEMARLVEGHGVLYSTTFDTSPFTATGNFIAASYNTVKAVDSTHYTTFSIDAPYVPWNGGIVQYKDMISPYVDFYDLHMYSHLNQPVSSVWSGLAPLDKPFMCGEMGVLTVPTDPNTGNSCDIDSFNVAPAHSKWCQDFWYQNTTQHVYYARQAGAQYVCLHSFPAFRWFSIRTDDGSNQWLGHQLTEAGQAILNGNGVQYSSWV